MTNTVPIQLRLLKMQTKTLPFRIWLTPGSASSSLENMTGDVDPPSPEQIHTASVKEGMAAVW